MSENGQTDVRIPPGEGVSMERAYPGSGHYATEVSYKQAKFVATAMDHAGLLDWESPDHDKQTACAVAIAEATRFILGIRGFIAIGAENKPDEADEADVVETMEDDDATALRLMEEGDVSSTTSEHVTDEQDRPKPHPEQTDDPALRDTQDTTQV